MAGIGFELRRLLRKNTLVGLIEAYAYAGVIGSGPWVFSIVGILLVGSIRHADVLLVNGSINRRDKDRLLDLYNQAPKPLLVVAIGACGCTGGIFAEGNTFAGPVDKIIPVDAYIPGCPPKPEAIISGIVKLAGKKG